MHIGLGCISATTFILYTCIQCIYNVHESTVAVSPSLSHTGETPTHTGWVETPHKESGTETPTPHGGKKKKSRWDLTPSSQRMEAHTPLLTTPNISTPIARQKANFSAPTPGGNETILYDNYIHVGIFRFLSAFCIYHIVS